ncbi:MAG: HD-GYP domain-containing protein [Bacteriovoracaceae bacterium]|nr:HD-GYP domain-containing protein [Bacteriovoracaceae bacterium]
MGIAKKRPELKIIHSTQDESKRREDDSSNINNETTSTFALYELGKSLSDQMQETLKVFEMAAKCILKALDCKDKYTYGHSIRVAHYCLVLSGHLGLSEDEAYELELSALFHDVGKIGISDNILCKPGKLTPEEMEVMKSHPVLSYEILKEFSYFENVAKNALHHHERFDGLGYPHRLKGVEIPLFSRIILISDTYDAITSSRTYREGRNHSVAFDELRLFAGKQFDPKLTEEFIAAMDNYYKEKDKKNRLKLIGPNKRAA